MRALSSPSDEQGLVQAVEHIDDHIVVGSDVHDRAWELLVDCDDLRHETGNTIVQLEIFLEDGQETAQDFYFFKKGRSFLRQKRRGKGRCRQTSKTESFVPPAVGNAGGRLI